MASREAQAIAEKYIPDFGDGNWGQAMRAGKVNGLARDIDALRIADLEAAWAVLRNAADKSVLREHIMSLRATQRKGTNP